MTEKKEDARQDATQAVQSGIELSLEGFFADLEVDVERIVQKQKDAREVLHNRRRVGAGVPD
ncbi:MAG: hypothetical protein HQM06_16110 [Magnetococcales bacterium]|nr:hypothetical protein [Magnetococcales bacterium]